MKLADWHEHARGADNTEVVISRDRYSVSRHVLTNISASFDTTASAQLDLYGLSKQGGLLDLTDTGVVSLDNDTITIAGHTLANADPVVFHTNGGTAPSGLTSGNTYFVVGVSGDTFKLESSVGGGAITLTGTQSAFATEAVIMPRSKSWQVYDHFEDRGQWLGDTGCPLIVKLGAVSSVQGIVNLSGYAL